MNFLIRVDKKKGKIMHYNVAQYNRFYYFLVRTH